MMSEDEERKTKTIVGIIAGLFLIYLVASASGIVPGGYNIFKYMQDEDDTIPLPSGTGYVVGFPDEVNVTAQVNNSYEITFVCNESYMAGMQLTISLGEDLVNTTSYWTATSTAWSISTNKRVATYVGDPLSANVEISNLRFHVNDGAVEDVITINITTTVGELDVEEFEVAVIL